MHILWGILKIAGIILLIILGLLLLILMIVLFIPVRYRGRITTGGDFTKTWDPDRLYVLVEATWLLKLVHVSIELREKKIRLIVKAALMNNATIVAFCHNHPSNNARPSKEDDRLTEHVKKACEVMRLYLLDHVIVTDGNYYSYREQGRL